MSQLLRKAGEMRMATKLNPDGAKIRAFRIQRGWTQEQLAEIAGISLRTVQRSESAGSAAFETIKAIAASFETDFSQLLQPGNGGTGDPELRPAIAADSEWEQIAPELPASKMQRIWPTPLIAVSALVLGLVIGILLKSHPNKHAPSRPAPSLSAGKVLSAAAASFMEPRRQNNLSPALPRSKAVPHSAIKATDSDPKTARHDGHSPSPAPAIGADTIVLDQVPQSAADLRSLQVVPLLMPLPEVPLSQAVSSDNAGFSGQETQDAGAVRQALGLTAKKTGAFVSKAGDSIKRVF